MFQNLGFYLVLGGETQTISVVNCSYHICIFSKLLHKIVRLVGPMHSNFTVWLLFMHAHFYFCQEDLLIISLTPLQNLSVTAFLGCCMKGMFFIFDGFSVKYRGWGYLTKFEFGQTLTARSLLLVPLSAKTLLG